ncbi:hypothetical protein [Parerythrobacter lacustris]|uniref:Peptidase M48 domain-containing protein n=1 Tax=Parerythrobacter lacustris TaxID=2969984 RepID=A0ABT1XPF7_9SPHN|nr:hypothetical protein [Parerythrobacter lacustris]MCR2832352.1 hypothetical protein [Parerythrobacter lacustris]
MSRWRAAPAALAALLLASPSSATGKPDEAQARYDAFRADFALLAEQDLRTQSVGWQLLSGNAQLCPDKAAASGLLLQDARAYGSPELVRRMLGLRSDIFVQLVVPQSPASALALPRHAGIAAIDGVDEAGFLSPGDEGWERLDRIERALAQSYTDGTAELTLADGRTVSLRPDIVCYGRFEVVSGRDDAGADGAVVRVGRDFPGFGYPEEEFAAALAHELAHNILRHPQWLAANGRKRRDVRETEREADRMMPWLLANAGYDPATAVRFMRRWGPKHNGGLLRKRTHDGWDERVELIEAELPLVTDAQAATGTADWTMRFNPREVGYLPF